MITSNSTLLSLLKAGCKVEFPSGFTLKGNPELRIIDVYWPNNRVRQTFWTLTGMGLTNALIDRRDYEAFIRQETK
jgi:hypothetical protein